LQAANLAIKHTSYFIDQIRVSIGDAEFEQFLHLKENQGLFNRFNKLFFQKCTQSKSISKYCNLIKAKKKYFFLMCLFLILLYVFQE
jgi:hypothetical protein